MGDVAEKLQAARERALPDWDDAREHSLRARIGRALVVRRRARAGMAVMGACVLLALGTVSLRDAESLVSSNAPSRDSEVQPPLLELEDGSMVTATSSDARVEPQQIAPHAAEVRLTSGAARFAIAPNAKRTFRVAARGVVVTVIGTVFSVGLENEAVRVKVERGRVRVKWASGERELGVGEQAVIDTSKATASEDLVGSASSADAGDPGASDEPPPLEKEPSAREEHAPSDPLDESWRSLAQKGDYVRAYRRMVDQGPYAVQDEPGDLLLAADAARLGGHPEQALGRLERVLSAHGGDSRAPLAAFTLGRTLLDQLGRPREAARTFAKVRRLDPAGTLAEDALAREVECWFRAGDPSTARARAEQYLAKYPRGQRVQAVRRFGDLN